MPGPAVKLFLTGGARSGKSALAEKAVTAWSASRLYIATMMPFDDEMHRRIDRHRLRRGNGWVTVEPPEYQGSLAKAVRLHPEAGAVLVDSVGPWISGLLCGVFGPVPDEMRMRAEVDGFVAAVADTARPIAVVSDEVGMGLVPPDAVGRRFRDFMGIVNQRLAEVATDAYMIACGKPVRLGCEAFPPVHSVRID